MSEEKTTTTNPAEEENAVVSTRFLSEEELEGTEFMVLPLHQLN